MNHRYASSTQRLIEAVLDSPGATEPTLRHAIEARAAQAGGRVAQQEEPFPPDLLNYVNKVARYAYKTTDKDIEELQIAGYSEDAIFEITLSSALGAAMARLESGLRALKGEVYAHQED